LLITKSKRFVSVFLLLQDATRLALRLVANYGLDPAVGISTYAPPPGRLGFMQKSFEVTVDNIDADLFGTTIPGGSFQPSDAAWHRIRSTAANIVKAAYVANLEDLERRKAALEEVAETLIEKETMEGKELLSIMDQHPPAPASVSSTTLPRKEAAAAASRPASAGTAARAVASSEASDHES